MLDFLSPCPLTTLASYLFDLAVDLAGEIEVMGILQRVSKHTQMNLHSLSLSFCHSSKSFSIQNDRPGEDDRTQGTEGIHGLTNQPLASIPENITKGYG
jgi:hypothetical protein